MIPARRLGAAPFLLAFLGILLASGCSGGGSTGSSGSAANPPPIVYGKIRWTTVVNGDTREYFVHVPLAYKGTTPVPVVFMFHGSLQFGEQFYDISGWKEKAEQENFIAVFPTGWQYCSVDRDGQVENGTKWNSFPLVDKLCAGQTPRDDVKFVGQMISELQARYNVNSKRIYASGFSSGGQFTSRLAVELSDKLAAVASNSGGLEPGLAYTPKRLLPVSYMVGNMEPGLMELNNDQPLPMDMESLFAVPFFFGVTRTYVQSFGLASTYTVSGVPDVAPIATFTGTSGRPENRYHFTVVKNMIHLYPNGQNFPLSAPDKLWDFFKQYSLP